jgi:hypothetical protein
MLTYHELNNLKFILKEYIADKRNYKSPEVSLAKSLLQTVEEEILKK